MLLPLPESLFGLSFLSSIAFGVLCLSTSNEKLSSVWKGGELCPFDVNAKQVSHCVGSVSGKNTI